MEKIINKKGLLLFAISRKEAESLGWGIEHGKCLCSRCNKIIKDTIYYNCVLHDTMDLNCLKNWYESAPSFEELEEPDKKVMQSNAEFILSKLHVIEELTLEWEIAIAEWKSLPNLGGVCYKVKVEEPEIIVFGKILTHTGSDLYVYVIHKTYNDIGESFGHFDSEFYLSYPYKIISQEEFEEQRKVILKEIKDISTQYELNNL